MFSSTNRPVIWKKKKKNQLMINILKNDLQSINDGLDERRRRTINLSNISLITCYKLRPVRFFSFVAVTMATGTSSAFTTGAGDDATGAAVVVSFLGAGSGAGV